MAKTLSDVTLSDLLPPSIAADEQVSAAASALDPHLQKVAELAVGLPFMSDIRSLPGDWLNMLGWQMHVEMWKYTESLFNKAEVIENAIILHMKRGTVWAVENALRSVGISGTVTEWYDYDGTPYHFRITLDTSLPSAELIDRVMDITSISKNLRSWCDGVEGASTGAVGYQYAAGHVGVKKTVTIEAYEG